MYIGSASSSETTTTIALPLAIATARAFPVHHTERRAFRFAGPTARNDSDNAGSPPRVALCTEERRCVVFSGQGAPEEIDYEGHRLATRDARLVKQRPVRRRVID